MPAAAIEQQLARILESQTFASAPMLRQFLQYLVEQTLTGRAGEVKEYAIGVDVFGRGPAFDPRVDTIVRVQARRLRAKLADYYRREGATDPAVLEVPKGRYAIAWRPSAAAPASTPLPAVEGASIVVLPFVNLSGNVENEFFTDGLTEELIGTLAAVAELKVVARTSAFHFKGRTDDIRRIGAELGVRTALEGSVRIDGSRIRITAQLIDLSNGLHLWSEIFERTLGAVFDIQEEIATAIVQALRVRLAPGEQARLRPAEPRIADAHEHYLKSRYFWHKSTPSDTRKSIQHLEAAIALDPTYAVAYAGLADAYILALSHQAEAPGPLAAEARRAAERALSLDNSAEAHSAMAMVLAAGDWNWPAAEREFRRALQLKPSFAFARMGFAVTCLCPMRRYREAIDELREVLRLDPLSVFVRVILAQTLVLAGDGESAVTEAQTALELEPGYLLGHVTLALACFSLQRPREALEVLRQSGDAGLEFPSYLGHLGYAHGILGHRAEAERVLRTLLDRFNAGWIPAVDVAAIYNGFGDAGATLEWLVRARRDRSFDSMFVIDDPRFVNLHTDARFVELFGRFDA